MRVAATLVTAVLSGSTHGTKPKFAPTIPIENIIFYIAVGFCIGEESK